MQIKNINLEEKTTDQLKFESLQNEAEEIKNALMKNGKKIYLNIVGFNENVENEKKQSEPNTNEVEDNIKEKLQNELKLNYEKNPDRN